MIYSIHIIGSGVSQDFYTCVFELLCAYKPRKVPVRGESLAQNIPHQAACLADPAG